MREFDELIIGNGELLGELTKVPFNVSFLGVGPNEILQTSTIALNWHPEVQHISISNFQTQEYYEDYFMTTTYSSSMQELQMKQVRRFVELSKGKNHAGTLIEIGCGDGSFLNHAKNSFARVVGVEPSTRFAEAARQNSHQVLEGYVQSNSPLTTEKFDFFASRQVFEHLTNPLDCLLGIRQMLNIGAIGVIEVPNGFKALREGRYFEFFPDHVNYYSVNSLVSLANQAGFNVISCGEAFNGDYLEMWVSLEATSAEYFAKMQENRLRIIDSIRVWSFSNQDKNQNALFGCGAKTLSIIAQEPETFEKYFKFAIDSDPNKIGKYIPNTGIEIVGLQDPRLNNTFNFWILALSYVTEIAGLIHQEIPHALHIMTFDSDLNVIEV
jgi:hypothetical protein